MSHKKRQMKAQVDNRSTRLIEAVVEGKVMIICLRCYNRRISKLKLNLSIYYGGRHSHGLRMYHKRYQLASWEKLSCIDRKKKNTNPNFEQRELDYYSHKKKVWPEVAWDPYDHKVK